MVSTYIVGLMAVFYLDWLSLTAFIIIFVISFGTSLIISYLMTITLLIVFDLIHY